ncbi:MAG: AAA family ATPase [Deltaproteobacteria bacterium]|jgi:shikimate kinase/3-dehydroquinate synthase|nr:AAA family ATPase [Deltaproteobacteria bacterium]
MTFQKHFPENFTHSSDGESRVYAARHVFLTGFMGAGKSTVGQQVAKKLGRQFVDMDEELQKRHRKTIKEIFGSKGEVFFRQAESALLQDLINHDRPLVVATGGGVVETPANLEGLKAHLTFFLDLPPEAAWARVGTDPDGTRPNARDWENFKKRYLKRRPLYLKCGRVTEAAPKSDQVAWQITEHILEDEPLTLTCEGRTCTIRTFAPQTRIPALAREIIGDRKLVLLSDACFDQKDQNFTQNLPEHHPIYLPVQGEAVKSMGQAQNLLERLVSLKLDRGDFLMVRGGGSVTDLGAFCAGLYRRGLNLILVPTTLLGAVDASVGGKTAVNLAGAKNQIGHFYLPREIWIDPWILADLPENLINDGLTETYKTGLLFDPDLASMVERHLESIRAGDLPLLTETVYLSAKAKAALVKEDFREEKGLRDVLNLGHTYGHAVESLLAPNLSHGRAVALGLAVALKFSEDKFGLDQDSAEAGLRICRLLAGGSFPEKPKASEVERLMSFDKKIRGGRLKFVVISAPGKPHLVETTPQEILKYAAMIEN